MIGIRFSTHVGGAGCRAAAPGPAGCTWGQARLEQTAAINPEYVNATAVTVGADGLPIVAGDVYDGADYYEMTPEERWRTAKIQPVPA
jgi:hypothetical protein